MTFEVQKCMIGIAPIRRLGDAALFCARDDEIAWRACPCAALCAELKVIDDGRRALGGGIGVAMGGGSI